jgi:beta-glucosidase
MLKRGEEKSVQFTIHEKDLRFTAADMKFKSEPGMFKVFLGTNSVNVLESKFELVE